ncbi:MAG: cytochrome c family protein [Alphaproteobacteria bacterium]|nr:cytochrome c family protein [Alphaproteobacteria bacterium]
MSNNFGFELNKIAAAVLSSLLFVLAIGKVSNFLFPTSYNETASHSSLSTKKPPKVVAASEIVPKISFAELLASGNSEKGAIIAKRKCASCHTFQKGGRNRIGPNLYGIAGRTIAFDKGFSYSSALKKIDDVWSWKRLEAFLESPRKYAPGTKMTFIGLKKDKERANVLAYMKTISPEAPPFPEIPPAEPEEKKEIESSKSVKRETGPIKKEDENSKPVKEETKPIKKKKQTNMK